MCMESRSTSRYDGGTTDHRKDGLIRIGNCEEWRIRDTSMHWRLSFSFV